MSCPVRSPVEGIKVAVLDTGIDFDHPDFIGREIASKSFIADQEVQDGHGHGTHCAGTSCGILRPSSGQPRYGIAHGAQLHVGKVLSNSGSGSDRSVMGGLEWALDSRVRRDLDVARIGRRRQRAVHRGL